MKCDCEIAAKYILPALRSIIAKNLIKIGLSQNEISKKLGLTQPAISQYLRMKRGKKLLTAMDEATKKEIDEISKKIAFTDLSEEEIKEFFCRICGKIMEGMK